MRRLFPTVALVVLTLSLSALFWGLASLQRIFIDEREEATAQVEAERGALQEYARRTLEQLLESDLHKAEVEIGRALDDPLAGANNILLLIDGHQWLPRTVHHVPGNARPARDLYVMMRSGLVPPITEPNSPWAERLALYQEFRRALRDGGHGSIERSFRALLRHRTRYVIDSVLDLPVIVAALEDLVERAEPNPDLLAGILRDGIGEEGIPLFEGLQPAILRRRDRFTQDDFQFLAGRILALSERSRVPSEDFRARVAEPPSLLLLTPERLTTSSLLDDGRWYARPGRAGTIIGAAVSTAQLMGQIDQEMRARGMIETSDELVLPPVLGPVMPVSNLPMTVIAPRFVARLRDANQNYWIKSVFLVGSFGLALLSVFLILVVVSRKQKFVDLKNDFVATVSHELRTPLASLRLMAETIERRTVGLATIRDYPSRMIREIDDLAFLVENILSFNRLDRRRWHPKSEPLLLQPLIDDVGRDLSQWSNKPVSITCHGLESVRLRADRELLRLLLHNLGKNACTYCEHGTVTLDFAIDTAAPHRRHLTLLVRDNGVGIDKRDHRRIFQDFYRGRSTHQVRGSGLGLAICRKIMQSHGGKITITQSGSSGTTFALRFPRALVESR